MRCHPSFLLLSLSLATLGVVGCTRNASDAPDVPEQSTLANDPAGDASAPAEDGGAAPSGPHIAAVRAHGTGCPNERTYEVKIAPDGASATIALRAYDVSVSRGEAFSIEDCSFAIDVAGTAGHAYSLETFESSGYASLRGTGVNAEESVKYYFQGNPVASETRQKHFTDGAAGADYSFANQFGGDSAVWSPCGGGRALNLQSRLVLRNNADKSGVGYISPSSVKVRLAFRRC
jgi:hypothetical protein